MKSFITSTLLFIVIGLVLTGCQTPLENTSDDKTDEEDTNTSFDKCEELYYFDDTMNECGKKEFCGLYMYESLQTFKTEKECEEFLHKNRNLTT